MAKFYGLGCDAVKAIDKAQLQTALSESLLTDLRFLAMDECAIERGHGYATRTTSSSSRVASGASEVTSRERHRTTPDELDWLLHGCDHRWQAMILLAYTAGLREAKIWNLTRPDVDFKGMRSIGKPEERHAGNPDMVTEGSPEASTPAVCGRQTGPHAGVPYRRRALRLLPKRAVCSLQADWGQGREPVGGILNDFLRMYHARCCWAGIPENEFHALRKTTVRHWPEAGAPPHEAQEMAGHSSVETTIRYHAKINRAAIDRVRQASEGYAKGIGHAG